MARIGEHMVRRQALIMKMPRCFQNFMAGPSEAGLASVSVTMHALLHQHCDTSMQLEVSIYLEPEVHHIAMCCFICW